MWRAIEAWFFEQNGVGNIGSLPNSNPLFFLIYD